MTARQAAILITACAASSAAATCIVGLVLLGRQQDMRDVVNIDVRILHESIDRLTKDAETKERSITEIRDGVSALQTRGIDGKPSVGSWWCNVECFRSQADCSVKAQRSAESTHRARIALGMSPDASVCVRHRIAFCNQGCFESYDMCILDQGSGTTCVGVE